MKKINLIVSAFCIALSAFVIYESSQFEETIIGTDYTGPSFFPTVTAALLIILAVVLAVTTIWSKDEISARLEPANLKRPAIGVGLMFFYILGLEYLGFLVATAILNAILLYIFKVRKVYMLILYPIGLSLIVYLVFRRFLLVDLPQGLIEFI